MIYSICVLQTLSTNKPSFDNLQNFKWVALVMAHQSKLNIYLGHTFQSFKVVINFFITQSCNLTSYKIYYICHESTIANYRNSTTRHLWQLSSTGNTHRSPRMWYVVAWSAMLFDMTISSLQFARRAFIVCDINVIVWQDLTRTSGFMLSHLLARDTRLLSIGANRQTESRPSATWCHHPYSITRSYRRERNKAPGEQIVISRNNCTIVADSAECGSVGVNQQNNVIVFDHL